MTGTAASFPQHLTVFCDFDGPIVDVSERYYSTYRLALADTQASYCAQSVNLPIQVLSKQMFWQMKQDRVPDIEIAMRSGLQGEQIDVFLGYVTQIVNQPALLEKDKMQPGVSWALALLHSQGVRLVLVTLRCQDEATQILQNYGLARLFSGIYGTQEANAAYQNYAEVKTQLLAKAIAEQPLPDSCSASAWMVGDTEADILAGQAWGIPTIALTCGIRSCYRLKKFQPTHIYSDLLSATHYLLGIKQLIQV
ncbi:MAG: HAD family hydrolase [Aphanothece sp. CMT-3BRIN-NPC111]|jgi:phosphoglycolate phosphatase-like HAD superfamily hydrolase|nr:HAD family hydrolase [Aphanothece sp. CMT-3BRIN-NPC111]